MEASGMLNGAAYSVSCDFLDPNLASLKQCQSDTGLHFLQCRDTVDGTGGVMGQLMVAIRIQETAQLGMTNYTVPLTGVELGGTLDTAVGAASPNVIDNQITLDAFDPGVSASGSFSAEWTDDGMNYFGTVVGTFDFTCP